MDWGADPSVGAGPPEPASDPALDEVRAAVVALTATDVAELDPAGLGQRIAGVEVVLAMLGAHQVDCVAVAERRGDGKLLGFRSTQSWLRSLARLAPGAAKGLVALARRISDRSATRDALADGRISISHAKVLARTIDELASCFDHRDDLAKMESELVDLAERCDPLKLADACRRLRIQAAPEQAAADDWSAFQARSLSLSRTFGGLGVLDATLDPASTETVMAAIHAFSAPAGAGDDRTPGQRRADALTEICRQVLTFGEPPLVSGERPHVSVIVPLETLEGRAGAEAAELAWAGPVTSELVRRIACDAAITRVITDGSCQPLDVGRSTRVVPAGIRKALIIRDRHCRYPGCDMPGVWCDAHHIKHWADGGPTALLNLVLLCAYHHARLHLTGEWIKLDADGTIQLIRDPNPIHHDDQDTDRGP